ncbi:MAG TPA: hypothetical protein VFS21_10925 [Roseiflexaceae bacterium]|nr:hypothetical protein [Roseiflexaceae bacterium]
MPKDRVYTTKDLIDTYIASQKPSHPDVASYNSGLLDALQRAFGVTIASGDGVQSEKRLLHRLFLAAIRSLMAIRTPGSDFLDGSLIVRQLEASAVGEDVLRTMDSISAATEESRRLHWELIQTLFTYLYEPESTTVTSHDVHSLGFDDSTEPTFTDYENW